ncbi:group II intron maturase-specific domain-containing protein [Streptomyces mirabilis]
MPSRAGYRSRILLPCWEDSPRSCAVWANYFKHAVAKHVFSKLDGFVWWRLIRVLGACHRWSWATSAAGSPPSGRWRPIVADGIQYFRISSVTVCRYRYRANTIPNPWQHANPV